MILSFSLSNFRSFRETQTLSMVASNRHTDHRDHLSPIPSNENSALPIAALYGANGAGKSNLVKGLGFLQELIGEGTRAKKRIPFAFDRESKHQPTKLEVQFIAGEKVFVYGTKLLDDRVSEEWLSELRGEREYEVFQRTTNEALVTDIEYASEAVKGLAKLEALRVVAGQPDQLFLHAIKANLASPLDRGPIFTEVLRWFESRLSVLSAETIFMNLPGLLFNHPEFASLARTFLREVATGVDDLRVETKPLEENGNTNESLPGLLPGEFIGIAGRAEACIEKNTKGELLLHEVKAEHQTADGERVRMSIAEESDGTRRLLHLLPAIHQAKDSGGSTFIVDEIDRSLHPLLAKGFVRKFLNECAGQKSQLIFTTHDTNFLDLDLCRRDEIWFAEKKLPGGFTELYSLSDFKVRTDLKIDKAYLQGRFEAIPPIEVEVPDWVRRIENKLHPSGVEKVAE